MKNTILLIGILVGILVMSCHDITVGYLSTENAGYDPDTLEVKQILAPDSVLNPKWDTYLNSWVVQNMWQSFGYNSPEECVEGLYNITKWSYNDDHTRVRLQTPWLSTKLQGVDGTQQIHVQIKEIKSSDGGEPEEMAKLLTVRGDGMFKIPTDASSIPLGRYVISLNVYNEGYSKDLDDIFTIIVK